MIKISQAALFAATLCLAAPLPAIAQDAAPASSDAPFTFEIEVPSVVAVDSSMSEDQIKAVFSSDFLAQADRLAGLNATSITIPELTLHVEVEGEEGGKATATYRNIVLHGVKDGRAASMTIESGESVTPTETTTYRQMSAEGFDMKLLLELLGIVKGDPATPHKPIYTSFSSAGSSQKSPMYSCEVGASSSTGFEARPNSVALSEVLEIIEANKDKGEPPPAAIKTVVTYAVDIFRALRGGAGTVGAFDCNVPGDTPISFKLAGATTGGFGEGVYPEIRVGSISVDAGELGSGALGAFVLKPIDLNPMLDTLDTFSEQFSDSWFETNWRRLIPSIEGLSLADFAIDAINPEAPEGPRVKAKVANFDVTLGKYVVGIPTDVSITGSGIEVPLPQDTTDPQVMTLLAAGITDVNMGFDAVAHWDEAAGQINVSKLAVSLADLGSMSISATLGNATDKLFDLDQNVAMASGLALTVKDVTINVSDDGMGAIAWPLAASQDGQTDVAAYRTKMAGFAEGLAIQLIGPTDAARQLGAALGDFVTGSKGDITITIKAKDPAGLPMAIFVAAQNDPSILAGQVEVTGTAN